MQGFIPGSRAPLMMDVVAAAILLVVPGLALSLWQVLKRRSYIRHQQIQVTLSAALGVVILLFEFEVRRHDWRPAASASPYYATWLFPIFWVHLTVAVGATVAWLLTLVTALRRFARPPRPGAFSAVHKRLGWAAAALMGATAVTGWTFYWVAFLA